MAPAAPFVYTEADAFWYLHLTQHQQEQYDAFYAKLLAANELVPDVDDKYSLLRFLKARQWDVEKAHHMYMKMAEWRKAHNVANIYETFTFPELDTVAPFYPHFYHKVDKFGRPVYIELLGKLDTAKLLHTTTEERLINYHIFTWERFHKQLAPACAALCGKPIVTTTVILDLKGVGLMSHFTLATQRLLSHLSHIDQDFYPESLGVMFLINVPFIFKTIWAFVYPMLEERTRKKIHVLGADYHKTLSVVIDDENLLSMFGGKSEAPNTKESIGPWQARPECNRRRWWPNPRVDSSQALLKHSESEARKTTEEDQTIKVEATLSV